MKNNLFHERENSCMRKWRDNYFHIHRNPCSTSTMHIASKINVTPKCVYLPISKLHSILAVANLLAHNNISQICYCGQISLQSAEVNCSFSDTFGGVTFILLASFFMAEHEREL